MASLTLKWGTIKGWENISDETLELLNQYYQDGVPMSAMADRPDDARKEILCKIIDSIDGDIVHDWSGETYTKEEAKEYVMEYRK